MKNILIYISLLVFSINLNAQKGKTIESKKFDDITVALGQMEESKYIGIGKVWNFKYGNYGVLRENAQYLHDYLNKLKAYL